MVSQAFDLVGTNHKHVLTRLYHASFLGRDFGREKGWPVGLFLQEGVLRRCLDDAAREDGAA